MAYDFKKLNLEQMVEYITKNAPEDKAWFKSVAFETRTQKKAVKQFDASGKPIIKIGKDGKHRQADLNNGLAAIKIGKDGKPRQAVKMEEVKGGEKKEVFNLLAAKYAFANRYMPEIIPVAQEKKPKASSILADW